MSINALAIKDPVLRTILIRDYVELQRVLKAEAAKSAVVLAGAIVEGILVDFLLGIGYADGPSKSDPREMFLPRLI